MNPADNHMTLAHPCPSNIQSICDIDSNIPAELPSAARVMPLSDDYTPIFADHRQQDSLAPLQGTDGEFPPDGLVIVVRPFAGLNPGIMPPCHLKEGDRCVKVATLSKGANATLCTRMQVLSLTARGHRPSRSSQDGAASQGGANHDSDSDSSAESMDLEDDESSD
ncbi:hypothetical protein NUW54_g2517 [Trametes sanguinea]|uniref:Uncharacterized protein n=1 Tax=Trametes sanguinea TaxID=158606 RepID=A0ACC1Q5Y8_9APHY|nr:hypothetical protein NUW54_g2517 [Trametes sanguinea]